MHRLVVVHGQGQLLESSVGPVGGVSNSLHECKKSPGRADEDNQAAEVEADSPHLARAGDWVHVSSS
jgi:hypothetical protein